VFLTGTSEGSPSRDVFGETIPPQGLQIIRVFGQTFSGKNECVALTKTQPEQLGVKIEYLAPVEAGLEQAAPSVQSTRRAVSSTSVASGNPQSPPRQVSPKLQLCACFFLLLSGLQ
jgi:hypothetical protein